MPVFEEPRHVGRPNMGDREAFLTRVGEIFDRGWFSNDGPVVREFESRLAEMAGVKHCVATCNGTIALEIAIRALGLEGEVIVPSYTFIATAHALHWQGITPVFADIDPTTHTLDPESVRRAITPRTTGIIGVHLWGQPAAVEELQAIADENGLELLFDAAHAFACTHRGRMIGSFGRAEVFSFHATKFFNSFEGGAVMTDDDEVAEKARLMRNFGFAGYDNVIHPGTNGKMIEVCAAMGLTNLETLSATIAVNQRNHAAYAAGLADVPGLELMSFDPDEANNFQYVVLQVKEGAGTTRDALVEALQQENVLARRYFWPGCHKMAPYRDLDPDAGDTLPVTEQVAGEVVVLPTGSAVSVADIELITGLIRAQAGR
ncbi:DegT/DnrJ/EryC1/StrS family aminotransferase [Nocardioides sp. WS12]|uniref:DegT/DnrJ/EryC1/StrS family aminotransferase n=1 Tax=Nocardioides sp. WS12 TaxID=2486272 RepID=UPI00191D3671|nr:DegT/DnrJ/EryC1/StrS family aminotransferase [Nocardioides sp. WS12]